LSAALFSGSVEFIQLYAPTRTTSFVDLATNTTGSVVGALMAAVGAGLGVAVWRWGESLHDSTQGIARYRIGPQAGRTA
jgi:glycopeptide antibiotics resistance protein